MALTRGSMRRLAAWTSAALLAGTLAPAAEAAGNDYPTAARVDYVLGCMAANGQSYLVMQKCACSIDTIAETIPYEQFERVETIIRMREGRGMGGMLFRTSPEFEEQVQAFKQAQVEADLRCF